ncbi:MAG: prolyl oligopeptidase family serine peptidase, partial [Blastopirellula sp. JB062]
HVWILGFVLSFTAPIWAEESIPEIKRRLPPPGVKLDEKEEAALAERVGKLQKQLAKIEKSPLSIDAEIYLKAVSLALRNGEFYQKKDIDVARQALDAAERRIAQIESGDPQWTTARGLLVRGYRSAIDDSAQPYGLHIPEGLDLTKPVPLYVWLHGRGDKETDLYFIHNRQRKKGYVAPDDAITLHPFGRQCIGFKSAGEIDVLDAIEDVSQRYQIDPQRIVLMGFSMGGAGAWHLGAHYADRWVAMSPGAGFAETARYQKLKPENFPPSYTQTLWGCYDVPDYVRNLFNLPVIAYSGEIDKQIQAARVMEEAYAAEGRELPHLIGPKTAHKYEPETLKSLLADIKKFRDVGLNRTPTEVSLQTKTLRYPRVHWVEALGLEEHWKDSRIDAQVDWPDSAKIATKNVAALALHLDKTPVDFVIEIDDQKLSVTTEPSDEAPLTLVKRDGEWTIAPLVEKPGSLAKRPGLQGPIDDVFLEPFMVVAPREKSSNARLQQWLQFEIAHFDDRWQALFRGKPRWKYDDQVTAEDIANYHLIAWGTPQTNRLIRETLDRLPLSWDAKTVAMGERRYSAEQHVPVMIYPNPLNPRKYLVLNSGPTFREENDRSNSGQNPQLPDWAIIDITTPPNGSVPGKVVAADFFDEAWQVKANAGAE